MKDFKTSSVNHQAFIFLLASAEQMTRLIDDDWQEMLLKSKFTFDLIYEKLHKTRCCIICHKSASYRMHTCHMICYHYIVIHKYKIMQ